MFWTAFVWGLGVSFGASIGMMCFVLLYATFKWFTESESVKAIEEINDLTYQALLNRNEISSRMLEHMIIIANAAHAYQESQKATLITGVNPERNQP